MPHIAFSSLPATVPVLWNVSVHTESLPSSCHADTIAENWSLIERQFRHLETSVLASTFSATTQCLLGGLELMLSWGDRNGRIVIELAKLVDEMDKIHNHVEIINPGVKWICIYIYTYMWVHLLHFTSATSLKPATWAQQGHSIIFWCIQITAYWSDTFIWRHLPCSNKEWGKM